MMCHIVLILSYWVRELVESILHSLQKTMVVGWCIVLESSSAIPKVWVLFFLMKMMKRKKIIKDFMLTYMKVDKRIKQERGK